VGRHSTFLKNSQDYVVARRRRREMLENFSRPWSRADDEQPEVRSPVSVADKSYPMAQEASPIVSMRPSAIRSCLKW